MTLQVAVEWAANWCSLSATADAHFADLAATLTDEQQMWVKFVRVNLDKAEVTCSFVPLLVV